MSKGKSNNKSKSNGFLISKNQTSRFSAKSRASLTRTLYVSLDNADKVIEGGPAYWAHTTLRVPRPSFAWAGIFFTTEYNAGLRRAYLAPRDLGLPPDGASSTRETPPKRSLDAAPSRVPRNTGGVIYFLAGRWALGAGAPRNNPSVLRSSSMSGQWIP